MRYLVLSDLHANIQALTAVLDAATAIGYDRVIVLGDLVGYGADPEAVVDCVRSLALAAIVRGNHDKVAAGIEDSSGFNSVARRAAQWTREALSADGLEYLRSLPMGPLSLDATLTLCHGSPDDEDVYIFNDCDALHALSVAERPLCLFGHTHLPVAVRLVGHALERISRAPLSENPVQLEPGFKYLVNPGSVGQPRDGDARAAFAILDLDEARIVLHRVEYAVADAQAAILEAGLPPSLAHRLVVGR